LGTLMLFPKSAIQPFEPHGMPVLKAHSDVAFNRLKMMLDMLNFVYRKGQRHPIHHIQRIMIEVLEQVGTINTKCDCDGNIDPGRRVFFVRFNVPGCSTNYGMNITYSPHVTPAFTIYDSSKEFRYTL